MAEVKIAAEKRDETGKGPARRARAAGRVPGVIYGRGMDPVSIAVDRRELALAYHTDAGMNVLLDIQFDGDGILALTKELQRDPVKGTLLHADFIQIDRTEAVEVEVPIQLVGESSGVKEGGVLEQPLHMIQVRSLPGDVPESIDADISELKVGDALRVADLTAPEGAEILADPDSVVANVAAPITAEALEAMEAAVTEGEPEAVAEAAPEEGTPAAGEGGQTAPETEGS